MDSEMNELWVTCEIGAGSLAVN